MGNTPSSSTSDTSDSSSSSSSTSSTSSSSSSSGSTGPTTSTPTTQPGEYSVEFTSGDKGDKTQNVGYPDFLTIQNSVPMPITQVKASCTGSNCMEMISYSLANST